MNCLKILGGLTVLLLLAACNNAPGSAAYKALTTQLGDSSHWTYAVDSLKFASDTATANNYPVFGTCANNNGGYLVGYNGRNNSLNVFDLASRTAIKNVFLDYRGNNAIRAPRSLYVQNLDSIFLLTDSCLFLIDTAYVIKKKVIINDFGANVSGINFARYHLLGKDPGTRLYYRADTHQVLLYSFAIQVPFSETAHYQENFMYALSLDNLTVEKVPVYYSALYTQPGHFYTSVHFPNVTFHGNLMVYNFPADPNIYTYDLHTHQQATYGGASRFCKNEPYSLQSADLGNKEKEVKWLVENTIYHQVIFDPVRKVYYRVHDGNLPYKTGDMTYNAFADKPYFLSVYDDHFRLLRELSLPRDRYRPDDYFVNEKGLWLAVADYRNLEMQGDALQFDLFRFSSM